MKAEQKPWRGRGRAAASVLNSFPLISSPTLLDRALFYFLSLEFVTFLLSYNKPQTVAEISSSEIWGEIGGRPICISREARCWEWLQSP